MKRGCIWLFVLSLILFLLALPLIHAEELKVTSEHPFLMNGKWIPAYQLKIGDKLKTIDGKTARITNIEKIDEQVEVYNLEASPYNDFVAGNEGVVVHNSNYPKGIEFCEECATGPCFFNLGDCGGTIFPRPGVKVVFSVESVVKKDPLLLNAARDVARRGHSDKIQNMIDTLIKGGNPPNLKSLVGTTGVLEAGPLGHNPPRIFFKRIPPKLNAKGDVIEPGKVTIAGYADKNNEQRVINKLRCLYP